MSSPQGPYPKPQLSENIPIPDTYETATFSAGCFWHVEAAFRQTKGVIDTVVGYTGGTIVNPTYKQVCSGATGHAEAVRVTYDPNVLSYEQLLDIFWNSHNPTQLNRQGPDIGEQYRSAVFVHGPSQEAVARASKRRLEESGRFAKSIVTQIAPAAPFYRAEEYHQRYFEKHGLSVCWP